MYLAQEIARLIESDPVAAAQVKEHIKPTRLCELLDVVPEPDVHEYDHSYAAWTPWRMTDCSTT